MKRVLLILIATTLCACWAAGQDVQPGVEERPIVESVDITGVSQNRLSRELRDLMQGLVGQRFDRLAVDEIAFHIQNEIKERVSAIRQLPGSQTDRIRLVYEFGSVNLDTDRESNVNSRYIVERVELRGISYSALSSRLADDMERLVGDRLNQDLADEIHRRIESELRPRYVLSRRVVRGSDRNHVRLIFEVETAPLLEFRRPRNYIVGHSKQSFSFGGELPLGGRHNRVSLGLINDVDDLLERYSGFHISFENIQTGTERLGFRLEYFDYRAQWQPATQLALEERPEVPGIYRERRGIEPSITVAVHPRVRVNLGASVTELQIQYPETHYQNANAGIASITYSDRWDDADGDSHRLSASYQARTASHNLDSDFIYTRHLGDVRYVFRPSRRDEVVVRASGGLITGQSPLFERFSLGSTSTLRGWNKFDFAPLGGDRMFHGSMEYRFSGLQVFYDAGSVWERGEARRVSHALGFGVHGRGDNRWFASVGIPIRSGRERPIKPVFMLGIRF